MKKASLPVVNYLNKIEDTDDDESKYSYVYFIKNMETKKVKIGLTDNIRQRVRDLKTAAGAKLVPLFAFEYSSRDQAKKAERELHEIFAKKRVSIDGIKTEWFMPSVEKEAYALARMTELTESYFCGLHEGGDKELLDKYFNDERRRILTETLGEKEYQKRAKAGGWT